MGSDIIFFTVNFVKNVILVHIFSRANEFDTQGRDLLTVLLSSIPHFFFT